MQLLLTLPFPPPANEQLCVHLNFRVGKLRGDLLLRGGELVLDLASRYLSAQSSNNEGRGQAKLTIPTYLLHDKFDKLLQVCKDSFLFRATRLRCNQEKRKE